MKKICIFLMLFIAVIGLSSCTDLNIPDGDIKDFISKFDADVAYQNFHYGTSVIINTYYDGNSETEKGKLISTAYFDKRNSEYYHYLETNITGDYFHETVTEYSENKKTLCYAKESDPKTVYAKKVVDGEYDELEYTLDDVVKSVTDFFYTEITAGFHTGGVYYGDYILRNISGYYNQFSLNEEKTILHYEINTSTLTEGGRIVSSHKYDVNEYGLLLQVNTISYYIQNEQIINTLVTDMKCDYVSDFEKKLEI